MDDVSNRGVGSNRKATPVAPDEAARRAAALDALGRAQPVKRTGVTFWEQHGGKAVLGGILFAALLLVALAVGKVMRTSISETSRAEQELRRGLR